MKTSSKTILVAIGIVAIGAIVYRAVNTAPPESMPADERIVKIFEDGGCAECHTADPARPFFSNWPIARKVITEDILNGYKAFDIIPMMEAIKNGEAINEVDLAKVERSLSDGSMPLAQYYLIHWGSSVTKAKEDMALAAIASLRDQYVRKAARPCAANSVNGGLSAPCRRPKV